MVTLRLVDSVFWRER